jgi:hypothetical protein
LEVNQHLEAVKVASTRNMKNNDKEVKKTEEKEGRGTKRKVEMQQEVEKEKGKQINPQQEALDEVKGSINK